MAINKALSVRINKAIVIEKQRRNKQNKQDLLKRIKLLKAHTLYVNTLMHIEMCHSPAEWKTKSAALKAFSKLKSKTVKIEAVKDQLRIHVLCFGWQDLHYAWSMNGIHQLPQ